MRKCHKMSRPQIEPQSQKPKLPGLFCYRTARKQSDGNTGEDSNLGLVIGLQLIPNHCLTDCVNLDETFLFISQILFPWLKKN